MYGMIVPNVYHGCYGYGNSNHFFYSELVRESRQRVVKFQWFTGSHTIHGTRMVYLHMNG